MGSYIENNWLRYLDDCYVNWVFGEEYRKIFRKLLNSLNSNIKFTIEHNAGQITFLDVLIKKDQDRLLTDINYKIKYTKQYLDYPSNHLRHIKRNIPYNLARRICIIVDTVNDKEKRQQGLSDLLIKRGYPKDLINSGITKAKTIKQGELRITRATPTTQNTLILVTTFNPYNPPITSLLERGLTILKSSLRMKSILGGLKFIHSRRQPPNLRELLVRSRFTNKTQGTVSPGGRKLCTACKHIIVGNSFTFKATNQPFKVKHDIVCNSKFLLYVLTYMGCS